LINDDFELVGYAFKSPTGDVTDNNLRIDVKSSVFAFSEARFDAKQWNNIQLEKRQ
ncbi:hypothetical protein CU098_005314, partial [Rhizopus stolonifer]